jgi:hypothetical protein
MLAAKSDVFTASLLGDLFDTFEVARTERGKVAAQVNDLTDTS